MGLFKRSKDLERQGLRGTAVVQSRRWDSTAGDDELIDTLLIRSASHKIDLEVHVDGRAPYRVQGTFKVPRKFWKIARGVELPVLVDPERAERIMIDWDGFEAAGGKQIVEDLGDQYRRDAVRDVLSQDPVQRESARTTVETWLGEVRAGRMSREDFGGYVDENVDSGLLTAEEGAAAKERAATPDPRPTPETHPPIEGVDYETWIRATVGIVRKKIPPSEYDAYYQSHGFPAGRADAVNAGWYERVQSDDVLQGWFTRDYAELDPS